MSVHRRRNSAGTVWVVRWYENGRGSRRHLENFATEAQARQRNLEVQAILAKARLTDHTPRDITNARMTFAELAEQWWDSGVRKPSTTQTHAFQLRAHILPALGGLRLTDITPGTLKAWRAEVRKGVRKRALERERRRIASGKDPATAVPTGDATADRCLSIVKAILAYGIEEGVIDRNPAIPVKLLRPLRSPAIDARSPETVELIRRQMNERDACLVSMLAYEGIRPAEAFVLRWKDVLDDLGVPRPRLLIRRSLSVRQIGETKNLRERSPRLFQPVADDLLAWWRTCGEPEKSKLVFPDEAGGVIRASNWRKRSWRPALASAGLEPFRPYDLRHSCATLLIYAGWNPLEVAAHLGHGDPGFTLRVYGHAFRDAAPEDRVSPRARIARARRRSRRKDRKEERCPEVP